MEADDRGAPKASSAKKKGKEYFNNPDREIDQEHLAELLRRSAELVERGEFGSVLYEALQDFRVYYKQKYPKTGKKKKSKKEKETTEKSSHPERVSESEQSERHAPTEENGVSEKPASASSEILDDLKQSEEKVSIQSEEKDMKVSEHSAEASTDLEGEKEDLDGDAPHTNSDRSAITSGEVHFSEVPSIPSETVVNDAETNNDSNTIDESARSEANDASTKIDESVRSEVNDASTKSDLQNEDTVKTSISEEDSKIDETKAAPSPKSTASVKSASWKSSHTIPATVPPSDFTGFSPVSNSKSPNKTLGFGKKFKLGKQLQNVKKGAMNVKKAAKNVTGKISENFDKTINNRHAHTGHDDIDFFHEEGIGMAESSNRRTTADQNEYNSRVTPGVAGANIAGSRAAASEHSGEQFENNYYQHYSSNDSHDTSDGDRNHPPQVTNQAGVPTFRQQQPPNFDTSTGEIKENSESYGFGNTRIPTVSEDGSFDEADPEMEYDAKPKFQRPSNTNSSLVVSGWIEQYRKSKFRYVWKEVLVSLVEGRNPGEVTTLWIQRENVDPATGLKELEALHRVPLLQVEDVSFTEQTTDNQFRVKVYNGLEDYVFRCENAPNDALRWVQTIDNQVSLTKSNAESNAVPSFAVPSTKGMAIRDLRAICHGAGVNTAGMERAELEAAAEAVQRRGTYFDQRGNDTNAQHYTPHQQQQQQQQQYQTANQANTDIGHSSPPRHEQEQPQQRVGIKELRAICHGAGINTAGMERRELEAAAKEVQSRGTYADPPIGMHAANDDDAQARQQELRRQQQQAEEQRRQVEERHRQEVEEAQRRAAYAEQERRRKEAEEEACRRAYEEEQRRRAAEEEARRRAAAEEQIRRQREAEAAQKRYAQQQAAWQQQQQAEEQRKRAAEQQAAAERRRRDEAMRKQQTWAAPAPGAHPPQQPQHYYQKQQQRHQGYPQQQWQQQHPQQNHHHQQRPPPQAQYPNQGPPQPPRGQTPPPPQNHQQKRHSASDNKYAKMANQSNDDGQAAITKIKHSILIQWALQPPQLQMLRPIAALVTTIHTVFPPALGVPGHDYFKKWKPINREDIAGVNGLPEEAKLKKSVRKIRFFLHPDKLPHDLDEEQKFTVKMLWDITNDSWEEYQKNQNDLDWVN